MLSGKDIEKIGQIMISIMLRVYNFSTRLENMYTRIEKKDEDEEEEENVRFTYIDISVRA